MNQFNGDFSCIKCLEKGTHFRTEKGGNIHVFPYDTTTESTILRPGYEGPMLYGPTRVKSGCVEDAQKAIVTGKAVHGIKGPSFLMFNDSFDYVRSTSIDYMHCVLQGMTELLLGLWFSAGNAKELCSLHSCVDVVNKRLCAIKPIHGAGRLPRTILDVKFWKASELKLWLLTYSIPVLHDIMKSLFLYHYAAFVEGIFLLSCDSISPDDLLQSDKLLRYFVFMFRDLYGERYLTLNCHSLLHLPSVVYDLGPLWAHSCFPFEDANGELLKMFHGTQYIDIQIVNAVCLFQTLPNILSALPLNSDSYKFSSALLKYRISSSLYTFPKFLGKSYKKDICDEMYRKIVAFIQMPVDVLVFYKRLIFNGQVYHSVDYVRAHARCSSTVKYTDSCSNGQYGILTWFAKGTTHNKDEVSMVCINRLVPSGHYLFHNSNTGDYDVFTSHASNVLRLKMSHLHILQHSDEYVLVPLTHLISLCTSMKMGEYVFTSEQPNSKEINL